MNVAYGQDTVLNSYQKRIEYYSDIIDEGGLDAHRMGWLYIKRGIASIALNRVDDGINDLKKSVETDPENILTHYNLANESLLIGNYGQGLESFKKVIEIDDNAYYGYLGRANIHFAKSEYAASEDWYKQSLEKSPLDVYGLISLTLSIRKQGRKASESSKFASNDMDKTNWPWPAYELLTGKKKPRVFKKSYAELSNAAKAEGEYFLGQYYLMKKKKRKARKAFQRSLDYHRYDLFEHLMSYLMLETLK